MPDAMRAARALARATSIARGTPDFLIIGGIRCGTTSMSRYLDQHPHVVAPENEIHYFDWRYDRGEGWYRSWFPMRNGVTLGEASPTYLMSPVVPERVASRLPEAKLIVLLRDPVERAISHFSLRKGKGAEPASDLGTALDDEERRTTTSARNHDGARRLDAYLEQGSYIIGLRRWFAHFPRDRFLLIDSSSMYRDPPSVYGQTLDFLGLPSYRPLFEVHNASDRIEVDPVVVERLRSYYRPLNEELYRETGIDLR